MMSCSVVLLVRKIVIKGSKLEPAGRAAKIRSRYAMASLASVTGGKRFGITMARLNNLAVAGTVSCNMSPSRK